MDSIDAGGIIHPIIITKTGQIMDGVRRHLAARQLQLDAVPCIERPEDEAATLIVETLIHRRHMTRGAAVYLLIPTLQDYIQGAERRRMANLKRQRKIMQKPLILSKPSTLGFERIPELCEHLGVSADTWERAVQVHGILREASCARLQDLFRKANQRPPAGDKLTQLQATLRSEFEPALLSGEKNLWNVLSGINGKITTEDLPRHDTQLEFWDKAFTPLSKLGHQWKTMSQTKRTAVLDRWRAAWHELPEDLQAQLIEEIESARKR